MKGSGMTGRIPSKFKSIQSSIFCAVSILVLSAVLVVTLVSLRYTNSSIYENSVMYTQTIIKQLNQNIDSYISYMDTNLSLNSICSYLNISTSYFSTIFKEMTGETFIEALTRTRMEKAKELLENTTMKNYEIAEKVGFSDPHYFGIAFKKITGKTPTEYAREKRR